jgi:hypothetical protein
MFYHVLVYPQGSVEPQVRTFTPEEKGEVAEYALAYALEEFGVHDRVYTYVSPHAILDDVFRAPHTLVRLERFRP